MIITHFCGVTRENSRLEMTICNIISKDTSQAFHPQISCQQVINSKPDTISHTDISVYLNTSSSARLPLTTGFQHRSIIRPFGFKPFMKPQTAMLAITRNPTVSVNYTYTLMHR